MLMTADETRTSRFTALSQLLPVLGIGGLLWVLLPALKGMAGPLQGLVLPASMLCVALACTVALRRAGQGWRDVGLTGPKRWGRTLALVVGGYVAIAVVSAAVLYAVELLGWKADAVGSFAALRGDAGALVYWLLVAWTSAAVGEELVFRGFVQTRLELLFGPGRAGVALAVLGQAVLFGLAHGAQPVASMLLTGTTGLVLGCVYRIGGRALPACMLLHGLVDTISLTAIYAGAV